MGKIHVPEMRLHKSSGRARVILNGRHIWLGKYGTAEAETRYRQVVAEWLSRNESVEKPAPPPKPEPTPKRISVAALAVRYREHAAAYYVKHGKTTTEYQWILNGLRVLNEMFGTLPADEFSPRKLVAVRDEMIRSGLARSTINGRINRIRRCFKWAVAQELVPPTVRESIWAVDGLRRGRSQAKETDPVRPVTADVVEATIAKLGPIPRAMVELQLLTGMRPGELGILRLGDIDRSKPIWEYVPRSHKLEHHGIERRIVFGPQAQTILAPFIVDCLPDEFVFCSRVAAHEANIRRRKRTRRDVIAIEERIPRDVPYTIPAYRRAITRACELAFGMPQDLRSWHHIQQAVKDLAEPERSRVREEKQQEAAAWRKRYCWAPNRLRHARATWLRARYGLQGAAVILGQKKLETTQIYAEDNHEWAIQIAAEVG